MKKKTSTLALVSLSASLLGAATAPDFVGADGSGSGDFSNPDHWNPAGLPGSKVEVTWKTPGTATCETPTSVGKMTVGTQDGAFVFDDGVFTSSQLWIGYGGVSAKVARNSLTIADGAIWKISGGETRYGWAANKLTTGSNGQNMLRILSGGKFATTETMTIGNGYSSSNRIEICAGGVMDATRYPGGTPAKPSASELRIGYGEGTSSGNGMDVYGSFFSTNAYHSLFVGSGTSVSNEVVVHDGGVLKTSGWIYIGKESSFNRMEVKAGGTVVQDNSSQRSVSIGDSAAACSNSLYVAEGADASFAASFYVGNKGSWNSVEYVNPTRLQKAVVGNASSSCHNTYYVHGDGSQALASGSIGNMTFGAGSNNVIRLENLDLNLGYPDLFKLVGNSGVSNRLVFAGGTKVATSGRGPTLETGRENEVVFDNAAWTHQADFFKILDDSRLTLRNGAKVSFENGIYLSDRSGAGGNDIRVLSGSTLSMTGARLYGSCSRILISNATVSVSSATFPFATSVSYPDQIATNNVFRFEGENPCLSASETITFTEKTDPVLWLGQTALEFAVPSEPYAAAPVRATGDINFCASTRIRLELPDPLPEGKKWYPIAQTTDGKITVSDIEALGSELPQGAMLRLSSDKKLLEVRVPGSPTGLMLILR